YSIWYFKEEIGSWEGLVSGLTTLSYDWDTSGTPGVNRRTRIRITADASITENATGYITVDNTTPEIDLNSISITRAGEGVIPDVVNGYNGRYEIYIKNSGWHRDRNNPPRVSFSVYDPTSPTDGSYAGIKAVAYRFVSSSQTGTWKAQTFTGNNQRETLNNITCDFEGENIQLEVVIIDDAQNSLTPVTSDPNFMVEVYNVCGSGNNNGNYSTYYQNVLPSPLNVDYTPPQILRIKVDKLPDGPFIGQTRWYNSVPIVYVDCKDTGGSGILEGVIAFTVDGRSIPTIDLSNLGRIRDEIIGGQTYRLYRPDILNGERIVFKSYLDKIGIEKPVGAIYNLYFPVYNAYGKQLRVIIWDKAGNMSSQFVDNPWYIETDSEGRIIRQEQISLYVDTVPPDTKATLAGIYMPTQFKDIGTYGKSYTDVWRHNKNFPRPEDCPPPSNYPNDYIDFIYYASLNNRFLTPFS
ncbi:MAG: hypothetical protein NZ891_03865, partial [bacterium]|nr:hypothetical protein [bacterium]MDW8163862.1 hypothetical protein [Candidatus Omnitrophota bacterium]